MSPPTSIAEAGPARPTVTPGLTDTEASLGLDAKVQRLREDFGDLLPAQLGLYPSPEAGYRMRAEFRIWHEGQQARYAMYPRGGGKPRIIDGFAPGSATITGLMPRLLTAVNVQAELRQRLFAVEFLTTTTGEAVISLIYHRPLGDAWRAAAGELATGLGCSLIGRSRGQKEVIGDDYVTEVLTIGGQRFCWRQYESAFTQPNAGINREMLGWASHQSRDLGGDLLELYCGNGNFTLVLAGHHDRVLATEVAKLGIQAARHNLAANGVTNVDLVRMTSAEVSQAFAGMRPFRRLRHLDLASYRFTTLLVDPPRAGLDDTTLAFAGRFEQILYISCNPTTLLDNVRALRITHRIAAAAAFDQFPGTPHLECGLLLAAR